MKKRQSSFLKPGDVINEFIFIRDNYLIVSNNGEKRRLSWWMCPHCKCGYATTFYKVHSGESVSCGCTHYDGHTNTKHGLRNHHIYKKWSSMKNRCNNPNEPAYKRYGGRGILVYSQWQDNFKAFYDYVTNLPQYDESNFGANGLSLDRIDNNGNYEPGNLRWATREIQARNRRRPPRAIKGPPGIRQPHGSKKWTAYIFYKRKTRYLGIYKTLELAVQARDKFIINNNIKGQLLYSKLYKHLNEHVH